MKVLLIGGGGREHALAWKLAQSPLLDYLCCAPGNAGIAQVAECVALDVADHGAVIGFCKENGIGLVVIGPEAPLVAGLADELEAAGIKVFGPSRAAAQLEGSKGFTKDLCAEYGIPTAAYRRFTDAASAKAYVKTQRLPIVIKADGLAAGKGVTIATTRDEVNAAIDTCFSGAFGAAGAEVVIEEFLDGEEASFFALVDGETALPLATAQDHKRAFDGDQGPNTGGMGAYSPAPIMTPKLCTRVMHEIVLPTARAMSARGTKFKGVLYAGLMVKDGAPKLIEYNVRFGDPEAQVLMLRLKSDLLPALLATAEGGLSGIALDWHDDAALCVVMAARGYPGAYRKGSEIRGLKASAADPNVQIFHAGTKRDGARILADGGRVLGVTARGRDIKQAQTRAYIAVDKIDWKGGFCRRDIGWRALARKDATVKSRQTEYQPYQLLERQIARIHQLLEDSEAQITWNDRLPDPDSPKQERQIDVSIRRGSQLTLVECRARREPQDVTWVEELYGKRDSLQAIAVIGVSSSGFTEPAIAKACRLGVILRDFETLTPEEVRGWGSTSTLTLIFHEFRDVQVTITMPRPFRPSDGLKITTIDGQPIPPRVVLQTILEKCDSTLSDVFVRFRVRLNPENQRVNSIQPVSIEIEGRVRRRQKQTDQPSVAIYGQAGDAKGCPEAGVERFAVGESQVVRSPEISSIVFDLSRVEIPDRCILSYPMISRPGGLRIRHVEVIGTDNWLRSNVQFKYVIQSPQP